MKFYPLLALVFALLFGSLLSDLRAEPAAPAAPSAVTVAADATVPPAAPAAPTAPAPAADPSPAESAKREEEDQKGNDAAKTNRFLDRARAMISDKAKLLSQIDALNAELTTIKTANADLAKSSAELAALRAENEQLKAAFAELERKAEHAHATASAEIASLGVPETKLPASASTTQSSVPSTEAELNLALEACGSDQAARFRLLRAYRSQQKRAA